MNAAAPVVSDVEIQADSVVLDATLTIPRRPRGIVVFAHGSGSGRRSPRNRLVAEVLQRDGFATLLLDLLEPDETLNPDLRFDLGRLMGRLVAACGWTRTDSCLRDLSLGLFGGSTGAAAALCAAAQLGDTVGAVVSRGGRPDLADCVLEDVRSPVLLIVGEFDRAVRVWNEQALGRLRCVKRLTLVPGACHLFEEPGALDEVARLASAWFQQHLIAPREETPNQLPAASANRRQV